MSNANTKTRKPTTRKIKRWYEVSLRPAEIPSQTAEELAAVGITNNGWYDPFTVSVWYDVDDAPEDRLSREAINEVAKVACKIESRNYTTRVPQFDVRVESFIREQLVG